MKKAEEDAPPAISILSNCILFMFPQLTHPPTHPHAHKLAPFPNRTKDLTYSRAPEPGGVKVVSFENTKNIFATSFRHDLRSKWNITMSHGTGKSKEIST